MRGVNGTGEDADPNTQWVETEVTRIQIKSVIARVRKNGSGHQIFGFVLNDGTPLEVCRIEIDEGPWQTAMLDKTTGGYSWKFFTFDWKGAAPGEHTIVSRATDMNGVTQPDKDGLMRKKTFLEDNSTFPRKVRIA